MQIQIVSNGITFWKVGDEYSLVITMLLYKSKLFKHFVDSSTADVITNDILDSDGWKYHGLNVL